jgi:cytochrome c-type biogenesis protein CcmH/NrfG
MSASVQRKLQQAHLKLQAGEVETAAALSAEVLQRAPRNPQALWLLGTARLMGNRLDEAMQRLLSPGTARRSSIWVWRSLCVETMQPLKKCCVEQPR